MKRKKLWISLFCLLAVVLAVGVPYILRASDPAVYDEDERLARAASLRAQCPYRDPDDTMGTRIPFETLFPEPDTWLLDRDAVLIVEITGDWEKKSTMAYPTGDPADGSAGITTWVLPVTIKEVVGARADETMETGDTAYLSFSGAVFTGRDVMHPGDTFAVAVMTNLLDSPKNQRNGLPVYWAGSSSTFYLADDGGEPVCMSMSSEALGPDSLSGLTLPQFRARMAQIMEASGW